MSGRIVGQLTNPERIGASYEKSGHIFCDARSWIRKRRDITRLPNLPHVVNALLLC